jgi:hypothetical protein
MVNKRCCRLLAGIAVLAATLVIASPAQAAVSASYGTANPAMPTVAACTGGTCMTTFASFASNGTVSTNVTVTVTLYRTAKAGATVTSTSDYVVKKASVTYATAKTAKSTWTLAATQKCRTVATVTYGYYSRVTVTNGTTTGTVSQNSAIKQLKGCVSV